MIIDKILFQHTWIMFIGVTAKQIKNSLPIMLLGGIIGLAMMWIIEIDP